MNEYISLGLLCTLVGAVIGLITLLRNKTRDEKTEGRQDGVVLTELGYIKANTDEIKSEQREQRKINTHCFIHLYKLTKSAKIATVYFTRRA